MRVTKTIRNYVDNQLNERRDAILAPYRDEANDTWADFQKEARAIVNKAEEGITEQLNALATKFNIQDSSGKIVEAARSVDIHFYRFFGMCEYHLPAKVTYQKKKEEVNVRFDKEREELLVSLELGDMDKKSLLAAIANAKLEG